MADVANPDLPRASAAVAEPTSHDPDARGHFGAYGQNPVDDPDGTEIDPYDAGPSPKR